MAERSYDQVFLRFAELINQNMRRELDIRDRAIAELREQLHLAHARLDEALGVIQAFQDKLAEYEKVGPPAADPSAPAAGPRPARNSYVGMSVLIDNYNRVVAQPELENDFRDKYGPIRFEVANRRDRRLDPELAPVFAKGGGDYWGIATKTPNHVLIVPGFGLDYDEELLRAGAMGEVFRVDGYRPGAGRVRLRLIRPAVMLFAEERWELSEPGELRLEEASSPADEAG
ncbi:hypothetical protein EDC14_100170 [Hydrogenispora ethanolica]|jgi:hypothetical protein|uniref:Uncharacterized protein n=1 Tax=Hydrogenispora ethanolica TaxID=1082276 RepID=A0A4R1SCN8_HYDET|nr:hypothetical protein [Hydrogenispora ethanolica]TCL76790.1 hypothetical protein EDC14_100170 [Hydrogenispora ethanolica]